MIGTQFLTLYLVASIFDLRATHLELSHPRIVEMKDESETDVALLNFNINSLYSNAGARPKNPADGFESTRVFHLMEKKTMRIYHGMDFNDSCGILCGTHMATVFLLGKSKGFN